MNSLKPGILGQIVANLKTAFFIIMLFFVPIHLFHLGWIMYSIPETLHDLFWKIFFGLFIAVLFLNLILSPFFWFRDAIHGKKFDSTKKKTLCFLWVIEVFALMPFVPSKKAIIIYDFLSKF